MVLSSVVVKNVPFRGRHCGEYCLRIISCLSPRRAQREMHHVHILCFHLFTTICLGDVTGKTD
jgi:hypothetical protein